MQVLCKQKGLLVKLEFCFGGHSTRPQEFVYKYMYHKMITGPEIIVHDKNQNEKNIIHNMYFNLGFFNKRTMSCKRSLTSFSS